MLAALVSTLLVMWCVLLSGPASAADNAKVDLALTSPALASSGSDLVVSGEVTNTGGSALDSSQVRITLGSQVLDTGYALQSWRDGKLTTASTQVGSQSLSSIPAGGKQTFSITIAKSKLDLAYGLAAMPLTVTVLSGGAAVSGGTVRTTLQWQSDDFSPRLKVSVVIPLTLPDDPALFGASGAARTAAWQKAIGPDSRIQRLLDTFKGTSVIWAVDPRIVDPPAAADTNVPSASPSASSSGSTATSPSGSSSSSSSPSASATDSSDASATGTASPQPQSTSAASPSESAGSSTSQGSDTTSPSPQSSDSSSSTAPTTPEDQLTATVQALQAKLSALKQDSTQTVWWLPTDDPDITALNSLGSSATSLVNRDFARTLPAALAQISTTRALWPVGDLKGSAVTSYAKAFARGAGTDPVAILPTRSVADRATANSTAKVSGTSGALLYDEELSTAFAGGDVPAGERSNTLLSDLVVLYKQAPQTVRSVALVAPRTDTLSVSALAAQVSALDDADWISLQGRSQTAKSLRTASSTPLLSTPSKGTTFPAAGTPGVTAAILRDVDRGRRQLTGLQQIVVDSETIMRGRRAALDTAGSTRWRGNRAALTEVIDRDSTAIRSLRSKVSVRSSRINFFADSGELTVTVTNELNREVRGVRVGLQPRKYLLRFKDSDQTLDVRAGSGASTTFRAEAAGAGTVRVDARITTPDGLPLGSTDSPTKIIVNVQPASGWIMWVLGGLAALVLIVGVRRALRRGPRTATEPGPAGAPTPDDAIVDAGDRPTTKDDEGTDTHG